MNNIFVQVPWSQVIEQLPCHAWSKGSFPRLGTLPAWLQPPGAPRALLLQGAPLPRAPADLCPLPCLRESLPCIAAPACPVPITAHPQGTQVKKTGKLCFRSQQKMPLRHKNMRGLTTFWNKWKEKYNQNKNYYQPTTGIWLAVGKDFLAHGLCRWSLSSPPLCTTLLHSTCLLLSLHFSPRHSSTTNIPYLFKKNLLVNYVSHPTNLSLVTAFKFCLFWSLQSLELVEIIGAQ